MRGRNTISKTELKRWIDDGGATLLSEGGEEITEEELWEQFHDGWWVGVVVRPVSNAISYVWVVTTNVHRNHHGIDIGGVLEVISEHEDENFEEFLETFSNCGGMVFELE